MTKIFGIGLSKTGTTSLTKALEILGYKSIHHPQNWLKINDGKLDFDYKQIEKYDTFTDIEIARFYKELDNRYPHSKFILTTRNIDSWLKSCKNHLHPYNQYNDSLNLLLEEIYGSNIYSSDEEFTQAYLRHYDDVINYFKDRPQDLLILDVNVENKWEKICTFLEQPLPKEAYPVANKASSLDPRFKNILRKNPVTSKLIKMVKRKQKKN